MIEKTKDEAGNFISPSPLSPKHVLPGGNSNDDRVEVTDTLPAAAGQKTILLGKFVHTLIMTVPAAASCTYSLKAAATATSPVLDGSMMLREESPEGVDRVYVYAAADMSAHRISIRGW